jgi:transposase
MMKEGSAETTIRDIKRKTRRKYSAEEKIRIVVEGLRGEKTIAELCRREGIAESLYYSWSKEFMEAGKARLTGNTKRQATSSGADSICASRNTPFSTEPKSPLFLVCFCPIDSGDLHVGIFSSINDQNFALARGNLPILK